MRTPLCMVAILSVIVLACLSTVHFEVTDSWYSDTESVDIKVDFELPTHEIKFVTSMDGPLDNLSESLGIGEYTITIEGADSMRFLVKSGEVKIDDVLYDSGSNFSIGNGESFQVTKPVILDTVD